MATRDLRERTRLFALSVLAFCRRLPNTDEAREAAGQLRRAANSLRSNYRSARKGRSRAEFQAKLGTAAEEADECLDWLEYFRDARIRSSPQLIEEARELTNSCGVHKNEPREHEPHEKPSRELDALAHLRT